MGDVQATEAARQLRQALAEASAMLSQDDDEEGEPAYRALMLDDRESLTEPLNHRIAVVLRRLARRQEAGRPPRHQRGLGAGPRDLFPAFALWSLGLLTGIIWARQQTGQTELIPRGEVAAAIERFDESHHELPLDHDGRRALLKVAHDACAAAHTPTLACTTAWIDGFGVGVHAANPRLDTRPTRRAMGASPEPERD